MHAAHYAGFEKFVLVRTMLLERRGGVRRFRAVLMLDDDALVLRQELPLSHLLDMHAADPTHGALPHTVHLLPSVHCWPRVHRVWLQVRRGLHHPLEPLVEEHEDGAARVARADHGQPDGV